MLQTHSNACNWTKHMKFAPCNTLETYNAHSSYIYQSLSRKSLQRFKFQPLLFRLHLKVDFLWKGCNIPLWIFVWNVFCLPLIFCNEINKCSINNLLFRASSNNSNWRRQISSFKSTLDDVFGVLNVVAMYCTSLGELPSYLVGLNRFWRPPWTIPPKAP